MENIGGIILVVRHNSLFFDLLMVVGVCIVAWLIYLIHCCVSCLLVMFRFISAFNCNVNMNDNIIAGGVEEGDYSMLLAGAGNL